MGAVGLGDHEEAARILVEAVHDAGPRDAADAGKACTAMGDQRIDEGAGLIAGRRMHDQAGRLVDDDQLGVLVDDVERDRLRLRGRRLRRRHGHGDLVAGTEAPARLGHRHAVDFHGAGEDERLGAGTAQFGHGLGNEGIETRSRRARRDGGAAPGAVVNDSRSGGHGSTT